MRIEKWRPQFTIFSFFNWVETNTLVKTHLSASGYDSYVFMDQDLLIDRVRQMAPHVVVFSTESLTSPLSDFVNTILKINSEIMFVCVAPMSQASVVDQYRDFNFAEFVPDGEAIEKRVLWAVDRTCEDLYLTYMNEQILEKTEAQEKEIQSQAEKIKTQSGKTGFQLTTALQAYQGCRSKEDLMTHFLVQVLQKGHGVGVTLKGIFFKYLPTVQSFVATISQGVDIEALKGIGTRISNAEAKDLLKELRLGRTPISITNMVQEGLKASKSVVLPVEVDSFIDGILVLYADRDWDVEVINNDFHLFQLLNEKQHWHKKFESLNIFDPVTELFNQTYFKKKLEEEVSRARRLQSPVSFILLAIDNISQIEEQLGPANRDVILKSVASLIMKTSRVNDLSFRTGMNEFSLVLPHCAKKGAGLRAERLRRMIESSQFAPQGLKVTVSGGISEFPSLCNSAETLNGTSQKALQFIESQGGNKVCLYKPAEGFKPEFLVDPNMDLNVSIQGVSKDDVENK